LPIKKLKESFGSIKGTPPHTHSTSNMDIHTLRKRAEDAEKAIREEKTASAGILLALPAWKQQFTEWAEDVLCERNADASTLELCFDADDSEVEHIFTEAEKRFTKKVAFRFSSSTTEGFVYGVLWAYSETNLLDGKLFIWQHTAYCCRFSCENYLCPINTQCEGGRGRLRRDIYR
jgi:hypothetical protein